MRVENVRTERDGGLVRRVATVSWEDCDGPSRNIYFAVDETYASDMAPGQQVFLIACLVLAMRHGDRRVRLDQPIGLGLRNGLLNNMHYLRSWYGAPRQIVQIDAVMEQYHPLQHTAANAANAANAASFLSGGVDSLATLWINRRDYALDHSYAVKDCLIVHGFDVAAVSVWATRLPISSGRWPPQHRSLKTSGQLDPGLHQPVLFGWRWDSRGPYQFDRRLLDRPAQFLAPLPSINKDHLSHYVAVYEWASNLKHVTADFPGP
jgi:hypothetical protein